MSARADTIRKMPQDDTSAAGMQLRGIQPGTTPLSLLRSTCDLIC
jgi:hypothetical protein